MENFIPREKISRKSAFNFDIKSSDKSGSGCHATTTPLGTPHLQLKSNLKKNSVPTQQPNNPNCSDPNRFQEKRGIILENRSVKVRQPR